MADPTSDLVRADAVIVRRSPDGALAAPQMLNNVPAWVDTSRGIVIVRVRSGDEVIEMAPVPFMDLNPNHPITVQLRAAATTRRHQVQMAVGALVILGVGFAVGRATA